jgi:hypothetical protein
MDFRIAHTFTASLARLDGVEQKAVKTTAFDLRLKPSNPGLRFHRLDRARDPSFWSVRASDDILLTNSYKFVMVGHPERHGLSVYNTKPAASPFDYRGKSADSLAGKGPRFLSWSRDLYRKPPENLHLRAAEFLAAKDCQSAGVGEDAERRNGVVL